MRSKEVEKAINDLMFIVITDIYGNEIRIDKTKIINEYNQSVGTVLDYIKELENGEVEKTNLKIAELECKLVELQKEIENSVSKDKVKEQIEWLENDIRKTKENIRKGNEIRTYINGYRKLRMKAFNTKSKEIKKRLENLLEE